jgi:hypothetical protein
LLGIRSDLRLCEEVHLNLAYRWFCRLGLKGDMPDRSIFPKSSMVASATAICSASYSRRPSDGAAARKSANEILDLAARDLKRAQDRKTRP